MSTDVKQPETRLAEEIVSVLPAGSVARACSDDRRSIRYTVAATLVKLRCVIFDRQSLVRLQSDPARAVKIEYLQRDLLRNAEQRIEFRYPRVSPLLSASRRSRRTGGEALAVAACGC